jgi:hypothetical protein
VELIHHLESRSIPGIGRYNQSSLKVILSDQRNKNVDVHDRECLSMIYIER